MQYNFDKVIDRRSSNCVKWDKLEALYGPNVPDNTLALWIADMDFEVAPPIIEAIQKRLDHPVFGYTYPSDKFFETGAAWINRRYDWAVDKEALVFCPGIVPALNIGVLAFTQPGDKVLSLTPVYGPFKQAVETHGREYVACSLDFDENLRASIDFDQLESLIDEKTKLLMLCSPHNPTGRVWSEEELRKIGDLAVKHDLYVISDEIHADFIYSEYTHKAFAGLSEDYAQRTLACYAPSKTFNIAGLAASIIAIANPEMRQKFEEVKNTYRYSGNLFAYPALVAAWTECDDWLDQLVTYLEGNRDYLVQVFEEKLPLIKTNKPESTYLLWMDCRDFMKERGLETEEELKRYMVDELGLAFNLGGSYGEEGVGFLRLNFATPRSILEEAVDRLVKDCSQWCDKIDLRRMKHLRKEEIMQKSKFFKLSLLVVILTSSLVLSACFFKPNLAGGDPFKLLEEQNAELRREIEALKAELAGLKPESSLVQETSKEGESPDDDLDPKPTERSTEPGGYINEDDEFVYTGDLEVDGVKLRDLSREELEAMPTIASTIRDARTGKTSEIVPPASIDNLYLQLWYNYNMNRALMVYGADPTEPEPTEPPLEVGEYDISDKSLLIYYMEAEDRLKLYELSGQDDKDLKAWLDKELTDSNRVDEGPSSLDFDSKIYASDGRELAFVQADFVAPRVTNKFWVSLDGQLYSLDNKTEVLIGLRDLITAKQDDFIFDSDQVSLDYENQDPFITYRLNFTGQGQDAALLIKNSSEDVWYYTGLYSIHYYNGEDWNFLDPISVGENFDKRLRSILPGEERTFNLDFSSSFGSLEPGFYRFNFSLEKDIEEDGQSIKQPQSSYIFFVIR